MFLDLFLFTIYLVIYGDGYEYEVERDDRSVFMRASKWDRLKLEQAKQPIKRRRIEPTDEDEASSSNESENEYMEDFPDRPDIAEIPTAALDNNKTFHSIMLERWEEDIIWDKEDEDMM